VYFEFYRKKKYIAVMIWTLPAPMEI